MRKVISTLKSLEHSGFRICRFWIVCQIKQVTGHLLEKLWFPLFSDIYRPNDYSTNRKINLGVNVRFNLLWRLWILSTCRMNVWYSNYQAKHTKKEKLRNILIFILKYLSWMPLRARRSFKVYRKYTKTPEVIKHLTSELTNSHAHDHHHSLTNTQTHKHTSSFYNREIYNIPENQLD